LIHGTVSFLTRKNGYALAMNRDERLTRVKGLPAKERRVNNHKVVGPSEPGGGTWIALNDSGATLALINWYAIKARVRKNPRSRGEVVNATGSAETPDSAENSLRQLPLNRINAFRLVGIFPRTREVVEWRWNLKKLARLEHHWRAQQWISSGHDEPGAQRVRSRTFRRAQKQRTTGSLDWLRRLHRSHYPERSAYSTCMHRSDAGTVSYSEVVVSRRRGVMRHIAGAQCCHATVSNSRVLIALK
jgi:hypothetical protein